MVNLITGFVLAVALTGIVGVHEASAQSADFMRVQASDNNCTSNGTVQGTPSGGGWTGWATDQDGWDPDCVRLRMGSSFPEGLDVRVCVQPEDQNVNGTVACTAWLGDDTDDWSDWAHDGDKWAFDSVRVKLETRAASGERITNLRFGFQTSMAMADVCSDGVSTAEYTPYMDDGGGWSPWTPNPQNEGAMACARIRLTGTISAIPDPVTTISYALNGSATYTAASSVTLDANDTIAINWGATNSPSSCAKVAGPADFLVSTVTGPDTTVTEPTSGNSTVFTVRCTNAGGYHDDSITVTRAAVPTVTVYGTKTATAETTADITLTASQNITSIRWASTGATSCSKIAGPADFLVSGVNSSDATVTSPAAGGTTTFTVSCTGAGGTVQNSINVSRVVTAPVTTISYALNGSATYTSASSVTLDSNDTIAINWSGTNTPTSCSKIAGPADFLVSTVTGPDTTVTEPTSGNSTPFTVRCTNAGGYDDATLTVSRAAVPTVTVYGTKTATAETASDMTLTVSENITNIRWASTNATSCSKIAGPADFLVSGVNSSDASVTSPTAGNTTIFTVSCTGSGGTIQDSISVSRMSLPVATLYVTATGQAETTSDVTIAPGDVVSLRWASTGATSCNATAGSGFSASGTSGSDPVTPPASGESEIYAVACSGLGGTAADSITVTAQSIPPVFTVSKDEANIGDTVTFTWSLNGNDAASCSFSGPGVPATVTGGNGTFDIIIQGSSTFRFTCLGGFVDIKVEVAPDVFES